VLAIFFEFAVILTAIVLALGFLVLVNRFWPLEHRRHHNDTIGWQIGVLGTTYAVIIAFMLYAVWSNLQRAEENADIEAQSLVNLFRSAEGLPAPQRDAIRKVCVNYADIMVNEEWPAMERQALSPSGMQATQALWQAVLHTEVRSALEQGSLTQVLLELNQMTERRRIRELQIHSRIPGILWAILLFGAAITIATSCLFGIQNFRLHCVQIIALTFLISLVLVAIADMDRPFQGVVRVSSTGFAFARQTMEQLLPASR